jgi:hypothetical protein
MHARHTRRALLCGCACSAHVTAARLRSQPRSMTEAACRSGRAGLASVASHHHHATPRASDGARNCTAAPPGLTPSHHGAAPRVSLLGRLARPAAARRAVRPAEPLGDELRLAAGVAGRCAPAAGPVCLCVVVCRNAPLARCWSRRSDGPSLLDQSSQSSSTTRSTAGSSLRTSRSAGGTLGAVRCGSS